MRLRRFDATGARALLEKAIEVDPRFALAHSALATAWATLGYDERARASAKEAFELSGSLPRAERMHVEGTYHAMASEWADAIATWQSLSASFPDDVEYALRLAGAQIESGAAKEGLSTVESFRKKFPGVRDPRLDLAEASAAETLSDFKREQAAAAAAAAIGEAQGARLVVAVARLLEGGAVLRQGQRDRAVTLFEEARRIYEAAGDRSGVARSLNNLAAAFSDGPDPKRAVALYEEGLAIARAIGDQRQVGRFLNDLAIQRRREGDLRGSLRMNQESLAIRRETGDRTNMAISLNNIGNVLLDLGDLQGASTHYQQSADMSREIGDRRGLARALHNASVALMEQGEIARSRSTVEEALALQRTIDDPGSVAISAYGLAMTAVVQGDLGAARSSLAEALDIDRRLDRPRNIAFSLHTQGDVALVEGDLSSAKKLYEESLAIVTRLGEKVETSLVHEALAVPRAGRRAGGERRDAGARCRRRVQGSGLARQRGHRARDPGARSPGAGSPRRCAARDRSSPRARTQSATCLDADVRDHRSRADRRHHEPGGCRPYTRRRSRGGAHARDPEVRVRRASRARRDRGTTVERLRREAVRRDTAGCREPWLWPLRATVRRRRDQSQVDLANCVDRVRVCR